MRIKLSELEKLPVCTSADLLPFRVEMPNTYLSQFAPPRVENKEAKCIRCGEDLRYNFRWGIAHGEGECSVCKWPARAYHWFPNDSGTVQRVERAILQYHPLVVKPTRKRAKNAPVLGSKEVGDGGEATPV